MQFNPSNPTLAITRDGLRLETICISVVRAGKEIKNTERRYQPSMQPHEIAELSLSLLEARDERTISRLRKSNWSPSQVAMVIMRPRHFSMSRDCLNGFNFTVP